MRTIIQRVTKASVHIENEEFSSINNGLLVLVGIEESDTQEDINWLVKKITNLRIFSDVGGKMNESLNDNQGELLVVSQFTLFASTKKGNRPSFKKSAKPEFAIPLYTQFIESLQSEVHTSVKTGKFGADMKVQLINDGPVTILLDSKNKE